MFPQSSLASLLISGHAISLQCLEFRPVNLRWGLQIDLDLQTWHLQLLSATSPSTEWPGGPAPAWWRSWDWCWPCSTGLSYRRSSSPWTTSPTWSTWYTERGSEHLNIVIIIFRHLPWISWSWGHFSLYPSLTVTGTFSFIKLHSVFFSLPASYTFTSTGISTGTTHN